MDALLNYGAQESTIADVNNVTTESTSSPHNCAKRTVSQPESYCTSFPFNWMTFTTASQSSTHTLQVRGRVESKGHRAAAWEKTQVNQYPKSWCWREQRRKWQAEINKKQQGRGWRRNSLKMKLIPNCYFRKLLLWEERKYRVH